MVTDVVEVGRGDIDIALSQDEREDLCRRALTIPGAFNEVALPVWYEAAVEALKRCDDYDASARFVNMAERAALLARQAKDERMMTYARRIQARSWLRLGQLLNEIPSVNSGPPMTGETPAEAAARRTAKHGGPCPAPHTRTAIARLSGISPGTQKKAQDIATIPAETFEALVESERPPSGHQLHTVARELLRNARGGDMGHMKQGMRAITLRAMEPMVDFINKYDPHSVATVFAGESAAMLRRAQLMRDWLDRLYAALPK
jgi:hypothetical protein